MNTEAPKHSPFLAGMRAEGRANHTTPEARKEYEAGYMAVRDITSAIEEIESLICQEHDEAMRTAARMMPDIDAAWSRIKAAIAGEVAT